MMWLMVLVEWIQKSSEMFSVNLQGDASKLRLIMQQDKDPNHTANITKDFFRGKVSQLTLT